MPSRFDPAALRAEFWALPPDAFVDRDTAAAVLFVQRQTLESWAIRGEGPEYTKISRRAMYRKAGLLAFAEKGGRVKSTAQLVAAA